MSKTLAEQPVEIRPWKLWVLMLGSPVIWFVQFQTNYGLLPWCCASGATWMLLAISVILAIASASIGLLSWQALRSLARPNLASVESGQWIAARFMTTLGIFLSLLFFALIVAQAIPQFIFDPCLS
jgi:hypothetical protein